MIKDRFTELPSGVLSLRVFGSFARGENDSLSDLDVLAVVDPHFLKQGAKGLAHEMEGLLKRKASVSWYGKSRMAEFFEIGHLFAWHIFRESFSLAIPECHDVVERFGPPSRYVTAEEDITSLLEILHSIPSSLERCAQNASYEGGLMFVCLRNIALSASSFSTSGLCFSRMSPYVLEDSLGITFPITTIEYKALMEARVCAQRGIPFQDLRKSTVLGLWLRGSEWAQNILRFVKEAKNESNDQPTSIPSENRA